MAAAYALARAGFEEVTVLERGVELGGLAGTFEQGEHFYPLAYHHILHRDRTLHYFLQAVGALGRVRWRRIRMLFRLGGKNYDLAHPIGFLRYPMSVADKSGFIASASATIDGQSYAIAYNSLLKPGDKLGGVVFGQLVDITGKPMTKWYGAPKICDKPDFMSLIQTGGKIFMINQFECAPAVMYLTELSQDAATGALTPIATRPIDFSGVNGASWHCAGMVTPWNTHLSSEEDVRDARKLKPDGSLDERYEQIASYLAGRKPASPYMWGWVPEVSILNGAGDTHVVKHFAMGRLATEIAFLNSLFRTTPLACWWSACSKASLTWPSI